MRGGLGRVDGRGDGRDRGCRHLTTPAGRKLPSVLRRAHKRRGRPRRRPQHAGGAGALLGAVPRAWRGALCGNQPVRRVPCEGPASPRHRAGVASMAWRSTRRFRTRRKILISTQVERAFCVSSPAHCPRVCRDAAVAFGARHPTCRWAVAPCRTDFSRASDVAVVEPPHRPDRPRRHRQHHLEAAQAHPRAAAKRHRASRDRCRCSISGLGAGRVGVPARRPFLLSTWKSSQVQGPAWA